MVGVGSGGECMVVQVWVVVGGCGCYTMIVMVDVKVGDGSDNMGGYGTSGTHGDGRWPWVWPDDDCGDNGRIVVIMMVMMNGQVEWLRWCWRSY